MAETDLPQAPIPYPSLIVVDCDSCGAYTEHDYMVHDQMTRDERLAVARAHLGSKEGWSCTPAGDFCPACRSDERPVAAAPNLQGAIDAGGDAIAAEYKGLGPETGRKMAALALAAAAPHLAQHGDPLPPREPDGFRNITCGSCTGEFGTNCDDHDIVCPMCEAQRCPCCGCWYGPEEGW